MAEDALIQGAGRLQGWAECQERLLELSRRQLFFVGGAPRSGTTWLQYLLDAHPEIRCGGEGLFLGHLATPLQKMMAERRKAIEDKNSTVFRHSGGFPLPEEDDTELLVGTAILLALNRLCAGAEYRAVGEKTPENVFFFPRLKRLFPGAKFIGIARDPRDVLSSAWHFFPRLKPGEDEVAAKFAFIRLALPSLHSGAQWMLALREQYPADCIIVTYDRMLAATAPVAAELFRFLGVSDADDVVADCVARTSFVALTGGRAPGTVAEGSFYRRGVVGDWRSTFTPEMNELMLRELGETFPPFGWEP